ncbi:MAG: hypothetical protein P8J24_13490 [Arenicellales bacterium]|nr:hypothetical protein [Arenicellales bacterium]
MVWATVASGNAHPGGRGNRVVEWFLVGMAPVEILDSFRYRLALRVRYTE